MLKKFLKENEENTISFVTIAIIIITLVIIIAMWCINMSSSNKAQNLNRYQTGSYTEVAKEEYGKELVNLLRTNNTKQLYKKINIEFLGEQGLNEENFQEYLLKNNFIGNSITIVSSSVVNDDNRYIYRFYYKNYSNYKYVNIIEENPNEYTISFEQEVINSEDIDVQYVGVESGIKYELVVSKLGENFVKYNLKLTNENELDVNIDFNDINSFTLVGEEFSIPLASVVAQSVSSITKGSSINRELYFTISNDDYNSCKGLQINNLDINGNKSNILIEF